MLVLHYKTGNESHFFVVRIKRQELIWFRQDIGQVWFITQEQNYDTIQCNNHSLITRFPQFLLVRPDQNGGNIGSSRRPKGKFVDTIREKICDTDEGHIYIQSKLGITNPGWNYKVVIGYIYATYVNTGCTDRPGAKGPKALEMLVDCWQRI